MNIFLNVIISVVATVILFFTAIALLDGDLTPYFIIVIFCGVIIGLLGAIYKKLIEIQKINNTLSNSR